MSYTPTTQETALGDWIAEVLSIDVIIANQSGSPPALPYAVFEVTGTNNTESQPEEYMTDVVLGSGFELNTIIRTEGVVSVSIYGDNASPLAASLKQSIKLQSTIRYNNANNIVVWRLLSNANVPLIEETETIQRRVLDFNFRYNETIIEEEQAVQSVELTNDFGE